MILHAVSPQHALWRCQIGATFMAAHATLTELALSNTKPPDKGTLTLWDGAQKHFGARISQGGTKSFIVLLGSGRRQTIGHYPTLSIAAARAKAKQILAERTLGKYAPKSTAWKTAVDEFAIHAKATTRPRTYDEYRRILKTYLTFGTTRLTEISKADLNKKLNDIKNAPSQKEHARVIAKIFFNWAINQGYLDTNPCTIKRAKSTSRDRVLSDEELARIWKACEPRGGDINSPHTADSNGSADMATIPLPTNFCTIVRLLILTGMRRTECASLQSNFIDLENKTICLPASLTKNRREHLFPIGQLAISYLASSTSASSSNLLFLARGCDDRPFNGWSKSKAALDKMSGVTDWTLHDLRRTFRTKLGSLGVAPHIAERYVNHISNQSEVEKIYDRYKYLPEMREAALKYVAWLTSILC